MFCVLCFVFCDEKYNTPKHESVRTRECVFWCVVFNMRGFSVCFDVLYEHMGF